jgi:ribosomal protein L37AE/L43A
MSEQSDNTAERKMHGDRAILDCPSCHATATVRRALGQAPGGGDVPIWKCRDCGAEWSDDGKPRWAMEVVADMAFGPAPAVSGESRIEP